MPKSPGLAAREAAVLLLAERLKPAARLARVVWLACPVLEAARAQVVLRPRTVAPHLVAERMKAGSLLPTVSPAAVPCQPAEALPTPVALPRLVM